MIKKLLFLILIAVCYNCNASTAQGRILRTWAHVHPEAGNPNIALFQLVNAVAAGCNTTGRWAVDLSTPAGKAVLAMILHAEALEKEIHVVGTGTCDLHGDSESIRYIVFTK